MHCDTNEQIVKAIETHYAEMGDYTTKLFGFNIHTHGLGLPGGAWHVTINRSSQESGSVFAYSYSKLYNQGTMTFYAHENVENLGVYIFSCSFTRALICGKIIINDVVSVQPQKEIEMKTTDINKVRYTNRWRIVYGICNN